jgi:CRP-like cAMP-binding protein
VATPLDGLPLFRELTPAERRLLAGIGERRQVPAGTVLFREGAPGDALYIILRGAVRITKVIPGTGEEVLAVLPAGSTCGEMALIDEYPRSATAVAARRAALLVIGRVPFAGLLEGHPELAPKVLWALCRSLSSRLRETNEKISSLFTVSRTF